MLESCSKPDLAGKEYFGHLLLDFPECCLSLETYVIYDKSALRLQVTLKVNPSVGQLQHYH